MADQSNHSTANSHPYDGPPTVNYSACTVLRKLLCIFLCEGHHSTSTVSYMSFITSRDRLLSVPAMVLPKHCDAKLPSGSTRVSNVLEIVAYSVDTL